MERTILHSDLNAFYASVECLYHPELREKPVAVCGDVKQRHGIVLAKNQLAKKFGVSTGEAIWQAKQKCPNLITVSAHYDLYMKFSHAARKIYEDYSDNIESFGLDECWCDVTGSGLVCGSGIEIAQELGQRIKRELGVTVSIGVSWNKIFAKLGSDYKKPDAVTVISKENYRDIVWPLPASDLLYVGRSTSKKLDRYGIHTIGQIANSKPEFLKQLLGKWGETLWAFASGYDVSPVTKMDYMSAIKSIGNSMTTYRDIEDMDDVWKVFMVLSDSVARRLREHGFKARTVQISIRDVNLLWIERQTKLDIPICTTYELAQTAMDLFRANWTFSLPLRLNFRACARMESQPSDMKRLINLTYNLQECVIGEEAGNDEALGKFLVDNDMIDCLRGIPDEALAFLDYKKIGSNQRDTEKGVFVDGHYVVNLSADFREVYDGEHLPEQPAESNSVIRLKLRKVNDDREVTEGEWLALPATQDELKATLGKLQAGSLDDCFIARNESIVPLFDNNFSLDADIEEINALAGRVVQLRDQNLLPKYKAILEFTGCTELDQAVDLTANLSCYDFYPEIFKEDDLRRRTFAEQYHIPADDPILKTIRFDHSDAGLMTEDKVKPTDYGFVRRNDAQFQQEYMKPDPSQQMGQI